MERIAAPLDVEAVGVLAEPVRRGLYQYVISQRHAVGRDEAARAVGISRMLAAFHLDKLVERGLLVPEYRRLTGRTGRGAGRPAKLYRRAPRDFRVELPTRRYELAAEVFAAALERVGPTASEAVTEVAAELGQRIGSELRARARGGTSDGGGEAPAISDRLTDVLQEIGFEPFVDEDGVVRLSNCPFHVVKERHTELACGMNLAFADGLREGLRAGGVCARLDPRPGTCCVAFEPCGAPPA